MNTQAATPKKGGHFKMGLPGGHTTDNLDPGTLTDEWNYNTNWMYRNCLVEINYKGEPTPELAESWESIDDVTWEFKIKEGPITMLSIGVTGEGRFKFVIAEGQSVAGPIPPTGNTNTRGFFFGSGP